MALKLTRAALAEALIADFVAAVERFAQERKDWLGHQAFVEADQLHPPSNPLHRHDPFPAPTAYAMVMKAVNERGEVELEILPDEPSLRSDECAPRRSELLAAIAAGTQAYAAFERLPDDERSPALADDLVQKRGAIERAAMVVMLEERAPGWEGWLERLKLDAYAHHPAIRKGSL